MVTNAGQCHDGLLIAAATYQLHSRQKRRTPMLSRNMKRFAASRRAALILAGVLVLGSGLTATAQSEDDGSPNGLEGTWRVQLTVSDCAGHVLRSFPAV